jgi:zinc transporter 2
MADAAHMLSDFASLGISLAAIYLGERPIVKKFNFGYKRAEVIGALLIIVIIWIVSGILLYLAIHRLRIGDYEVSN